MLTFTNLYTDTMDTIGVPITDTVRLAKVKRDINQGLALFKNAARRYWTRQEITTNVVAGQQYYQLPSNAVRVTEAKVVANGLTFPLKQVTSEHRWNQLNVIPAVTINVPTYFFIRGYNEIGLWPIPSTNVTNGLVLSFEPRMADMSIDDVTGTATVTNGSVMVTDSGTNFTQQMIGRFLTVTDGTDGNWYKVGGFTSTSVISLENVYQGLSGSHAYLIGQCPDIPEEYHVALEYYAIGQFFMKRKDPNAPNEYMAFFKDMLTQYEATYAAKTTSEVIDDMNRYRFNIFTIPPNTITG